MVSVLQRSAAAVLLHVSLLAAALVRVSALSLVYLAALFSLLLLPLQFSKQAYRIVLFLRVFAPVVCLAQLAFQIYLGSQKPYARKLDHDSVLASTLAQIGFVRFDVIWHTVLRFLAPDIVVALVALAVPRPLNPQAYFTLFPEEGTGRLTALWVAISDTGIWMLLGTFVLTCCNAAAPAVLFYLVYLSLIAAFVFASLKKWVARCRPLLSAVLTLYLAATYVFQLPFVYQAMEPSADVLGLISYVEQRPPAYHASPVLRLNDLAWPLWILLVAQILTLYLVTAPFRRFRRAQTITTRPSLLEPLLGGSDEEQQHFNPLGSRDMRNDFAVHKRSRSAHRSHGHVDEVDEVDDDDGFGYHDDAAAAADDDDDDDVLGDEGDDVEQYDDDDVVVDGDTLGDDSKNGPSFMSHLWTQAMTSITTTAATLLRPVVKVCVNQSWIVTLVALYTWALAFPSWFGVVMIAWSLVAVYPETPTLFFRSSFVLIVFGGVITLLNLLFFIHPDIIPDKDVAEQLGLHEHASLERITGTIAAKLLFMFVFALTARAFVKTPWFQRQLRSTAHTHGSSGSTGGDSSPTSTTATTALLSDRRTTTRAAGGARDDHHAHRDQQLRRRGRVNDSDDAEDDDDDDNGDDGGRGGYSYHGYSGVGDGDGVGGRGSQAYANMDGGDDGKHTAVTPMVSPSPSSPSSSSWWKAKLKHALSSCADALLFVWDLCLRYAYLLTVLIVYVASLNEVTVFNAAYLVILIAFLGFPRLREEYWVWLLLYCTAVILVNYLWGFPSVRTSDSTVESLLGLDPAIHHHIWRDLRWHIAILGLSLIQLLAYRLIPSTRVSQPPALPPCDHDTSSADGNMDAHHRTQATRKVAPQPYSHALPSPPSPTAPAAASITEPLLAHDASHAALVRGDEEGVHAPPSFTKTHRVGTGTGDREHTNTNGDGGGGDGPRVIRWLRNTDRWLELQAKRYWAFVVCLALFLGGILGTVTFMRLGYLALLTVQLLLFELGQHAVMRKVWYIVLLYAGVVLVAKYMYQFEDLRPRLNRAFGEKLLEDAGFRVMNSQRRLFIYLLPATLTLVAAVIQTRVQTSERSLFEGPMFPSRTILQKAAVGFLRMCALHVEQVVIGLALASALRPTPEGMDIITILLIGLVMLIPKSKRVLHFLLLAWMAAMALAKLAYQLHEVKLHINETELSWFGLHPIHGTKETPLALVQWEIYVMLSSICRRVLRDVRGRLWGDDNTRGQRCFFDEPPPRPESIERMAESRTSTSGSTSDGDGDDDAAAVESVPLVESTNTSGVFGGGVVPEEPRVWTMDAVSTGLKFVINHYFELFGMYLVLVLALVAALVRLNVVSLFYLVVVGVLAVRRNTITHGAWRTILIVQAILFLYLYASALGLPDNVEYPWDGVASRHYALRVVLRWVYLPPNHPGHESTHEPNNGIIPRAPLGWSTPEVLYADFFFLLFGGMQLPLLYAARKSKFTKRYATIMAQLEPLCASIKRTMLWTLPWVCLLLTLMIPLSRRSVLALIYVGQGFYLLLVYVDFYTRVWRAQRYWRRLFWFNFAVVSLHVLWVLPALLIDWSTASTAVLNFVQFTGLRYGMGTQLLPSDPRVSVWSTGNGLLFDVLLLLLILPLQYVLNDPVAPRTAADFKHKIVLAEARARALAPRLKEQILRHKQRTATRVELAKRFIQRLSEYKRKDSTHAYRERELALWFLRRRDASTLLSQSLTAPDEDYPEDTSGKDDASGDGVAGDQGKHEGASAPTSAAAPRVASTHDLPPTPVATTTTDDTSGAIDAHAYGGDGDLDVDLQPDPEEEVVLMTHPPEQQDGGAASAAQQPDTTAPRRQQQQQKSEDGSKEKDAPKPPLLSRLRVWIITTWRSGLKALQTQLHEANHVFEPLWRDDWTSSSSLSPSSPGCARFDEDEPPPSASKPPPSLSTELYRFWSTHTHVPCYLLLIINVLVESSFLAVLLPLFYFLWGGLVRPFPSIVFWKALTFYSIGTILLKLAFQFEFWGQFNAPAHSECRQSFFNDGCMDFPRFLGIWRYADTPEFLVDLLPDMLLLLSLFVHRVNLRSLGMWQPKVWPDMDMKPATTRQQRKKDKQAQDAIASGGSEHKAHALVRSRTPSTAVTTAEVLHMDGDTTATEPHFHHEHADVSQHSRTRTSTLSSLRSRRSASASSILSGASTHDDGWAHDRDDTDHHRHHHRRRHRRRHRRGSAASGGTSLLHRFTKGLRDILDDSLAAPRDYYIPSFLVEFLSFIVICFGWSGFRRREQFAVSTSSIIQDNNIPSGLLLYMLMQFLFIIVDRALYLTRNVRGKLIFHCLVALLVHFLVFYWIPSTTRRSFRENSVIIVLYILKVVYLFLSAAQIRATFPLSVQRNSLTRHSTLFGFVVFQVYRAIPFMHELRMLLDWSCTATTLHLNDWYRVEDINGQLFSNQYTIKSEKKDGRRWGEKQPLMQKLATGVSLVAVLVIVLWFPLLIMSLINNRAEPNVPNRVEISLSVNSFEPIFVMDTVPTLPSIAAEDYAELESVDPSGFVNSFRQSDVQRVLLSPQSKSVWTISPSSRARLLTTLRDNTTDVVLEFTVRFTRDVRDGVAQVSTETRTTTILPEEPTRLQLLEALNTSNARVHLPFVYASTFHLSHEDMPRPQSALPDSLRDLLVNCTLFRQIDGTHEWWTMLQSSPHVASATDNRNISHSKYPASQWLEIVTFNDRVVPESLSFISSYGIVGLYVSVVLVIGRFIRLSVDNVSHKIIFEKMPQVLAVRSVLDALYLSREHGELWTEESIFQLLLRLYRSPEALLVWTDEQLLHEYEQQRAQSTPSTASSSS